MTKYPWTGIGATISGTEKKGVRIDFYRRTTVEISERQQEFLDFIRRFQEMHGHAPTYKEIAIGLEISSKGSVSAMMLTLEKMGLVEKSHGLSRGTRLRHPVHG